MVRRCYVAPELNVPFVNTLKVCLNMPSTAMKLHGDLERQEVSETKKTPAYPKVDESISEFERARSLSKTWSMSQD